MECAPFGDGGRRNFPGKKTGQAVTACSGAGKQEEKFFAPQGGGSGRRGHVDQQTGGNSKPFLVY